MLITKKTLRINNKTYVVWVFDQCSSTLDLGWELIKSQKLSLGDSILAYEQKIGRGQFRRRWSSPKGNLFVSWYERFAFWPKNMLGLALGLACVEFFQKKGIGVGLKWPNDLIWAEKKIGGILIEERKGEFLAGIGLNLRVCPDANTLDRDGFFPPGCLQGLGLNLDPLGFWLELKAELIQQVNTPSSPEELVAKINQNLLFQGRNIIFKTTDKEIKGVFKGINRAGQALVLVEDKLLTLESGQIVAI